MAQGERTLTLGRRAWVVLFLAMLAAACGDDGERASTPADTAGDDAVRVSNPGARPRARLSLHPAAGSDIERVLVARIGVDLTVDGERQPTAAVPPVRMVMSVHVDRVQDGTISYSFEYTDVGVLREPGVDPAVADVTEARLADLEGLRGTGSTDLQGGSQKATIDTSRVEDENVRATLDSLTSQLTNLTAPLPSVPVGVGATWTADRAAVVNGMEVTTSTTYTLRSLNGDDYALDVVQDMAAPPGPARFPGLPEGATATIESYEMRTTGGLTGNLARLLPDTSRVQGAGDVRMSVTQGGDRASVLQHLTLDISLAQP